MYPTKNGMKSDDPAVSVSLVAPVVLL